MSAFTAKSTPPYNGLKVPDYSFIPGMLSLAEKRYLYGLTFGEYEGRGAVVEIGSWLGNSAAYLARGLKDRGFPVQVYCYDRFVSDASEVVKAHAQGLSLEEGQDALPLFRSYLKEFGPGVVAFKTRVEELRWDEGPIEILHIDAPKKIAAVEHVFRTLGPQLIPKKTIVVMQDFVFPGAYAIPLVLSSMGEAFRFLLMPDPSGPCASFRYEEPISFTCPCDIYRWPKDTVVAYWKRMENLLSLRAHKAYFNFGLARYFYDRRDLKMAEKIVAENLGLLTEKRKLSLKQNSPDLWGFAVGSPASGRVHWKRS